MSARERGRGMLKISLVRRGKIISGSFVTEKRQATRVKMEG